MAAGCAGADLPQGAAAQSRAAVGLAIHADIAYAENEHTLVHMATLIIVGSPQGDVAEVITDAPEWFASYRQGVAIEATLRGRAGTDTVQLGRAGLSTKAGQAGMWSAEDLRGALAPGRYVLFLQPSMEPGVMQIVGHASGELPLDEAGRVGVVRPETGAFAGLTVPQVQATIERIVTGP